MNCSQLLGVAALRVGNQLRMQQVNARQSAVYRREWAQAVVMGDTQWDQCRLRRLSRNVMSLMI